MISLPRQLHLGDELDAAKVRRIENRAHTKPLGGLWTADLRTDGGSVWSDLIVADAARLRRQGTGWLCKPAGAWTFQPRPLRIVVCDSAADLTEILLRYPLLCPRPRGMRWGGPLIDWEHLAHDCDGLRVTARGLAERPLPAKRGHADPLRWFDIPSTLFFEAPWAEPPVRVALPAALRAAA